MTSLTLIRGLPGSGKSTLAKKLAAISEKGIHIEADQYFYENGVYNFNPSKLKAAHNRCQERVLEALTLGYDVFVSNTFTQLWEFDVYMTYALGFNIQPNIILCQSNFGSVHGVPPEKLEQMRNRFEYDIT